MAKRRKVLPARKSRDRSGGDHSLLLRSAESLGRVIGALQRQLDQATKRLRDDPGRGAPSKARAKRSASRTRTVARKRTASRKRKAR